MRRFLPLFILLTLPCSGNSQKYTFTEIKTDSIKRNFKKILIVSFGSVEARLFCENLSGWLIKELASDDIEAEFKYLGVDAAAGNREIKKSGLQKYDAIVTLSPADSTLYITENSTTTTQSSNNVTGPMQITTRSRQVTYSQTFNIQLLERANQNKMLWSASLFVFFDPGKAKVYKDITKKMISSLRKNKLVQ